MTLAIDAELTLESEHGFEVWTEGGTVVVNAPSLWALRELRSLLAALPVDSDGPSPLPVEVELRVRRATVARTTGGTGGGWAVLPGGATPDWRGVLVAAVRALG